MVEAAGVEPTAYPITIGVCDILPNVYRINLLSTDRRRWTGANQN